MKSGPIAVFLLCGLFMVPAFAYAQMRCSTNALGKTVCRDDLGNTYSGGVDASGSETLRDNTGKTMRRETDSSGTTTYRDNYGNTIRCNKDALGSISCR